MRGHKGGKLGDQKRTRPLNSSQAFRGCKPLELSYLVLCVMWQHKDESMSSLSSVAFLYMVIAWFTIRFRKTHFLVEFTTCRSSGRVIFKTPNPEFP